MNYKRFFQSMVSLVMLAISVFMVDVAQQLYMQKYFGKLTLPNWGILAFIAFVGIVASGWINTKIKKVGFTGIDAETSEEVTIFVGKARWLIPAFILLLVVVLICLPPVLSLILPVEIEKVYIIEMFSFFCSVAIASAVSFVYSLLKWHTEI